MTHAAGKIVTMLFMTECHGTGIFYCKHPGRRSGPMTFFAVTGCGKSRFTIVTRSARLPLLHLLHRVTNTPGTADKNGTVAFIAFEHFQMVIMAEPGIKGLELNIRNIFVAFLTIAFG